MPALSRRGFLATAGTLPAAAPGLLPVAPVRPTQAAEPAPEVWAAGARPDVVLSIERHQMAPSSAVIRWST
jgi:hypothetical protein